MSEEKSKGISLRKKRKNAPKTFISGPIPIPAAAGRGTSSGLLDVPRPSASGGKTSDLVKRRYSTRFTQLPDFTEQSLPVPALPTQFNKPGSSDGPGKPSSGGKTIPVDVSALRDPNLQADGFKDVRNLLANASEQEIRDYQSNLLKMRNRTSIDLQQNVYQNRTQFIQISKEAEKLKEEMRTLWSLISELKANTNALVQAAASSAAVESREAGRQRENRSSVAYLSAMWNTQLQTLWKNVEGSQKFLPAIPGRHIVRDSPHWVELNAATWKPKPGRAMHMFLLNDHLLIASQKTKRGERSTAAAANGSGQPFSSKLVAERCWPLLDIDIVDLSTSPTLPPLRNPQADKDDMQMAINIRAGQESFTYRNIKPDKSEKIGLLLSFRKTADELRKSIREESRDAGKVKDSIDFLAARDPAFLQKTDLLESFSDNIAKDRPKLMIDVDGKQQNLRWVENQIDELDVEIALQRLEEAVARIERLKKLASDMKGSILAQDLINFKVDERAGKLADIVTRQLVETHAFLRATRKNVSWLFRLKFEDRARESYLEARGDIIRLRMSQCIFEGDLPHYIYQISFVYFTLIKNTVTIYQACFPPLLMSACVKWAKDQVDEFNKIVARQLSHVEPQSPLWDECLERVKENSAMMTEVGLDFKNLGVSRS
ncbi:MAG: exocyst complex component exo84 [Trizodia sp. TS-e1964]|nr:MAG: exocyst complex component exo84 [Trizodia sp. TS-e1964]